MDNILDLHCDLSNHTYKHSSYQEFEITDPKKRKISKASVRDRLLHHAVYRLLYPFFDRIFIADSYSCRKNKGTHKALDRFKSFFYKVSNNNTRTCWVLKCDIKKFFASIDHEVLKNILQSYIPDRNIMWLLSEIIDSFHSKEKGVGLPLGNLTSQLFVNIYMNEFDQYVKHDLKQKYYIRYADDFVFLSDNKSELEEVLPQINSFLKNVLKLKTHKISIQTVASGVDYLGWVHFPHHRVIRTTTKKRMLERIKKNPKEETFQSYRGLLSHGNTFNLESKLINLYEEYK